MLDPLGALVITFFVMSFISILGVLLMFLVKNEKIKKGLFYGLSIWALVVAYCNIQGALAYLPHEILIAGGLGFLAVAALLIQILGKKENSFKLAQILTAVSVVAGMIDTFII